MEFLSPEVFLFFFFSTLPTTDVNVIFEVQLDLGFNNAQFWMHNEMFFSILRNLLSPYCQFSGLFFFFFGWLGLFFCLWFFVCLCMFFVYFCFLTGLLPTPSRPASVS